MAIACDTTHAVSARCNHDHYNQRDGPRGGRTTASMDPVAKELDQFKFNTPVIRIQLQVKGCNRSHLQYRTRPVGVGSPDFNGSSYWHCTTSHKAFSLSGIMCDVIFKKRTIQPIQPENDPETILHDKSFEPCSRRLVSRFHGRVSKGQL